MSEETEADLGRLTLEELLELLKAATQEESVPVFTELVKRFEPVVRKGWRRTRNVDYQEFANEVFERALGALPSLRQTKAFPLFFRRVVQSVTGDLMRRAMKEPSSLEDVDEVVSAVEAEITLPLVVRSYLEYLDERDQTVLELEYIYGFTTEEIASRTGLRPAYVRTLKSRALRTLRAVVDRERQMLERLQKK